MRISIKPGVRLHGLQPQMLIAFSVWCNLLEQHGLDAVITSGSDGKHKPMSLHYAGKALDFRTKHIPRGVLLEIIADYKLALGADFDVVMESLNEPNEHAHAEWDPKSVANGGIA